MYMESRQESSQNKDKGAPSPSPVASFDHFY